MPTATEQYLIRKSAENKARLEAETRFARDKQGQAGEIAGSILVVILLGLVAFLFLMAEPVLNHDVESYKKQRKEVPAFTLTPPTEKHS